MVLIQPGRLVVETFVVPTKVSTTYNLFHHLQQHHKVQYEECVKLRGVAQTVQYFQSPA